MPPYNVLRVRQGIRRTREVTTAKASYQALRIVQDVLKESLSPNGLTTAEIFKLATSKPPPPFFKPAYVPLIDEVGRPPNLGHPVRSIRYLKRTLLPMLEGNGVIRMKPVTREPDAPSSSTSPSSTLAQKLFAWIPVEQNPVPKPKIPEPPKETVGSAVGVGEDWSHLNTRRKRARAEKVAQDYEKMKEVLMKHGKKGSKKLISKTLSS